MPTTSAPIFEPIGAAGLRRHTVDVFDAMEAFIQHMRNTASPYAKDFEECLSEARRRQAYADEGQEPAWDLTLLS